MQISPLSTFLNGRFQRELWNVAPFDAAAKSAENGEGRETTNEVVSGGIQRDLPRPEVGTPLHHHRHRRRRRPHA